MNNHELSETCQAIMNILNELELTDLEALQVLSNCLVALSCQTGLDKKVLLAGLGDRYDWIAMDLDVVEIH